MPTCPDGPDSVALRACARGRRGREVVGAEVLLGLDDPPDPQMAADPAGQELAQPLPGHRLGIPVAGVAWERTHGGRITGSAPRAAGRARRGPTHLDRPEAGDEVRGAPGRDARNRDGRGRPAEVGCAVSRHEPGLRQPSGSLVALADLLPQGGRALDVAGGTGRHALWPARRGLDVTLADLAGVALELARREAARAGLPLRTLAIDLEAEPLPPGPRDLILCVNFLWPALRGHPRGAGPVQTARGGPSDPLEPPAPHPARPATPAGGRRAARAGPGPGDPAIIGGLDGAGPA